MNFEFKGHFDVEGGKLVFEEIDHLKSLDNQWTSLVITMNWDEFEMLPRQTQISILTSRHGAFMPVEEELRMLNIETNSFNERVYTLAFETAPMGRHKKTIQWFVDHMNM